MPRIFQAKSKIEGVVPVKTISDSWDEKYYHESVEKGFDRASRTTYNKIVTGFILHAVDKIVKGDKVFLGGGNSLGNIQVVGRRYKPRATYSGQILNMAPSWTRTKKLRQSIGHQETGEGKPLPLAFCFNEHTNGIRYKIRWLKMGMINANKFMYCFIPARLTLKRKVYDKIMAGYEYDVLLGNDYKQVIENKKANRYAKRYKYQKKYFDNSENFYRGGIQEEGTSQGGEDY